MPITTKGTPYPLLRRVVTRWSPTNGYTVTRDFSGINEVQAQALLFQYVRDGAEGELLTEAGISHLSINDATQNYVLDVWQVGGVEESVDGLSHPSLSFLYTFGNNVLLKKLRLYLDEPTDTNLNNLINADEWNALTTDQQNLLTREWERQLGGQTSYRKRKYVLRHTTNAPNNWQENISDFGISQIYTPAQILTEAQDASLWDFPLPGRLAYKIANIPIEGPTDNYLWGWLKGASTEGTAANNRVEINQEYELDLWSTDKYDPYAP